MSPTISLLRAAVASAALVVLAEPAHAVCIDAGRFRQIMADTGQFIRYAATVRVRGTPTPAYVAVGRNGAWTAYFVFGDVVACVIASGRAWTKQGEIPPADLRPGG